MRIGVDIGGTYIKAGLVDKGEVIEDIIVKTGKTKKEILSNIFFVVKSLFSSKVKSIGVGCPGPFKNLQKGIPGKQKNLPLNNVELKKEIKKRFKVPVFVNNDANCFALAETIYGKGKDYNIVLGITLGTGLGTGLVINKNIYSGRGNALEFSTAKFQGETYENLLGAEAIMKIVKRKNIPAKTPEELFNRAKKGCKRSAKAWEEYGKILGEALAFLTQTLDPEIIIVGGKITGAWKYFSKNMNSNIKKNTTFKPPKVVRSTLNGPGVIGASLLSL